MRREFDLNIEKVLEDWTVAQAIREIIANALDEQIITKTEKIQIFEANGEWHVRDFGRGIQYIHLTQNENEEKLSHPGLIGKFGVGLKDALATFDRHNINITINSKYGSITIGKSQKHGFSDIVTLHAYIDSPEDSNFVGTDFCIKGCTESDIKEAKDYFLTFSNLQELDMTEYGSVYERKNGVAEIFINGIKVASEDNFLFSYNITSLNSSIKKALNRERTNVGRSAYSDRVKSILLNITSDYVIDAFTDNLSKMSDGKQCDEMKWVDVQAYAVRLLNSRKNTVFVTPKEMQESSGSVLEVLKESGKTPIFVPETVKKRIEGEKDIEGNQINTIKTVIMEFNNSFEYDFVERSQLSEAEKAVFDLSPRVIEMVKSKTSPDKVFISNILKADETEQPLGIYEREKDRIIILRSQLLSRESFIGTLIHELTHADSWYGDVSRGFESHLTNHLGMLGNKVLLLEDDLKNKTQGMSNNNPKKHNESELRPEFLKGKTLEELEELESEAIEKQDNASVIVIDTELLARKESDKYYRNRAQAFYEQEEYQKAMTDVEKAKAISPDNLENIVKEAIVLRKLDKEADAEAKIQEVLSKDPTCVEAMEWYFIKFFESSDFENAKKWNQKICDIEPRNIKYLLQRIAILEVNGEYDACIGYCDELTKEHPNIAKAYFFKAYALHKKSKYNDSVNEIQKAISIEPDNITYRVAYGALSVFTKEGLKLSPPV